ncbi:MAG: hypothetical protein U0470_02480 [Anaerolineae bacterium]
MATVRPHADAATADAPDVPIAFDADARGDLIVAMRADVAGQGGINQMADDCVTVNDVARPRSST